MYLLPLIAAAVFYLGNYGRVLVRRFKPERAAVRRTLYVAMIAALPVLGLAILRGFTIAAKNDGDDIANKWQVRHSPVALQVKAGLELHGSLIRTSNGYVAVLTDPVSRGVVIVSHEEITSIKLSH